MTPLISALRYSRANGWRMAMTITFSKFVWHLIALSGLLIFIGSIISGFSFAVDLMPECRASYRSGCHILINTVSIFFQTLSDSFLILYPFFITAGIGSLMSGFAGIAHSIIELGQAAKLYKLRFGEGDSLDL